MNQDLLEGMTNENLKTYFDFFEGLKESGRINMFGASPYLAKHFKLDIKVARAVWVKWTETY